MCLPDVAFICSLHRGDPAAQSIEEADALADECPWNPDELPDHLKGYGYRGADQDGFDGSEWVTPEEDFRASQIEAARLGLPFP